MYECRCEVNQGWKVKCDCNCGPSSPSPLFLQLFPNAQFPVRFPGGRKNVFCALHHCARFCIVSSIYISRSAQDSIVLLRAVHREWVRSKWGVWFAQERPLSAGLTHHLEIVPMVMLMVLMIMMIIVKTIFRKATDFLVQVKWVKLGFGQSDLNFPFFQESSSPDRYQHHPCQLHHPDGDDDALQVAIIWLQYLLSHIRVKAWGRHSC